MSDAHGYELAEKCGYACPSPDDCDFPTCQCSDTPRTDAALVVEGSAAAKAFGFVNADFARQLERELRDLTDEIKRLSEYLREYEWMYNDLCK